jgi:hypothetical protein
MLSIYQRDRGIYVILKKELADYKMEVMASDAPILNQYIKAPEPFEITVADIGMIEKEIVPVSTAISLVFGETKVLSLTSIRIAVGSSQTDFVTLDETDLGRFEVQPTINGLLQFIEMNLESIQGICDRNFDPERGNIVFMEFKIRDPTEKIHSITLQLMTSLQQRGLSIQANQKFVGLQLYTIIKADALDDQIFDFLKELGVNWEVIYMRRNLALQDWISVECERQVTNLKGYLRSKYATLTYFDVNAMTEEIVRLQLNFNIADQMGDILSKYKEATQQSASREAPPFNTAEIMAAATLACAVIGTQADLEIPDGVPVAQVNQYVQRMSELVG